ncbi:hypothetical protein NQ315_015390 [Exocentrus adspersus]|uniref:RNA-binding S4 domain-containing protein n=1 Tax=Exocentrus adspersus TaxID=1586481 RepID=A0AAV8V8Y1_9CUCU|nr:hypothetical protein NQ315_015390 [Exocentrus adspersus]
MVCPNSIYIKPLHNQVILKNLQFSRFKSKDKSELKTQELKTESEELDSDRDILEDIKDKYTKTLKINVTSMRLDALLKAALGISRNKIETLFYESKIRLNGKKVLKKSVYVQEGDEIDVIKGSSINNKEFLNVARVEILSAIGNDENIAVKVRRSKVLTIENYEGQNRWEE